MPRKNNSHSSNSSDRRPASQTYPTEWYYNRQIEIDNEALLKHKKTLKKMGRKELKSDYAIDLKNEVKRLDKRVKERQKVLDEMLLK